MSLIWPERCFLRVGCVGTCARVERGRHPSSCPPGAGGVWADSAEHAERPQRVLAPPGERTCRLWLPDAPLPANPRVAPTGRTKARLEMRKRGLPGLASL